MALVIQNEAGTPVYVPYERPPQDLTLWSAIPRGLQSFLWTTSLDLIAVGNDALMNLNATLDPNFAYVMADCNLTLAMTGAGADWSPTCNLNLQNFYRAPASESLSLSADFIQTMTGAAQDGSTKSMVVIQPFATYPMFPVAGTSGILVVLSAFNNAQTARAAGVIVAYCSFWVFDLEQARKYPINSPVPTHAR